MICEIITTGTEIIEGRISNDNGKWLSKFLYQHGIKVCYISSVGDYKDQMTNVMKEALERADLIITTGGLGATQGDITKEVMAAVLKRKYVPYKEETQRLISYYEKRGRAYSSALDRQAWFAEGSKLLNNEVGSASGAVIEQNGKMIVHLPGPPSEMKHMIKLYLINLVESGFGNQGINRIEVLVCANTTETKVENAIWDLIKNSKNPSLQLLARPGYISIRMNAHGNTEEEVNFLLKNMREEISRRIPVSSYNIEQDSCIDLCKFLMNHNLTLSTAESLTGGLLGKLITDIPGSSSFFKGSAVTYWNETKENILNVNHFSLEKYTAVSEEVAYEMVNGVKALYHSDVSISTTGYAGPGLGERGENSGLVFIGISGPKGTNVYREQFLGTRDSIRYATAYKAFYYLLQFLEGSEPGR